MERAVKGLVDGRYQWVVFTSANAVRAVWEKFVEFGLDARAFSGVKIACVGEGTAAPLADGSAPEGFEIKGNQGSMKFHTPDSPWYGRTKAEVWFATPEAAKAAGFVNAVKESASSDEEAAK